MASIIPGYNYDIFISYRQKDNYGYWNESQNKYNLKGTNKLSNTDEIISILESMELLYSINERVPGINDPIEFKDYLFDDIKYKHQLVHMAH